MKDNLPKDVTDIKRILSDIKNLLSRIKSPITAFSVFQFCWLIEIYFLGLSNVIIYFRSESAANESKVLYDFVNSCITPIMVEYNDIILGYFSFYARSVLLLGIYFILAGFVLCLLQDSFLGTYLHISTYCSYGLYAGQWLLLIYISYWLSQKTGPWFIIIQSLSFYLLHKGLEFLREKHIFH